MEHELLITSASGFRAVLSETFNKKIIPRLIHGCLLMIFQNSTGINAMNNFSVTFFQVIGFQGSVRLPTSSVLQILMLTDSPVGETVLNRNIRHS